MDWHESFRRLRKQYQGTTTMLRTMMGLQRQYVAAMINLFAMMCTAINLAEDVCKSAVTIDIRKHKAYSEAMKMLKRKREAYGKQMESMGIIKREEEKRVVGVSN